MKLKTPIIVLGGTTASGKTDMAVSLSRTYSCEILNCDSRQMYRYLTIGTAKPDIDATNDDGTVMIQGIRHHLINLLEPNEICTLADFKTRADRAITEIHAGGMIPLLTGGTGLYIDAVVYDYTFPPDSHNRSLRTFLNSKSIEELQAFLLEKDTGTLKRMNDSDRKNPRRLIRAIELSGKQPNIRHRDLRYRSLYLVLDQPKDILQRNIEKRVDAMLKNGLLNENKILRDKGFTTNLPSMQTIGYKEFDQYFDGTSTIKDVREMIILHTTQYAKRQRTWFKRNPEAHWISTESEADALIRTFLSF